MQKKRDRFNIDIRTLLAITIEMVLIVRIYSMVVCKVVSSMHGMCQVTFSWGKHVHVQTICNSQVTRKA